MNKLSQLFLKCEYCDKTTGDVIKQKYDNTYITFCKQCGINFLGLVKKRKKLQARIKREFNFTLERNMLSIKRLYMKTKKEPENE